LAAYSGHPGPRGRPVRRLAVQARSINHRTCGGEELRMDETMNDSSSPTSLSERQVGRRALIGGAALAGGLLAAGSAAAQGGAPAPAAFEPKPLPFAAGSIPGFSE